MSRSLKMLSDEDLFRLVKEDDNKAYTELYDRFKRPLMAYALKKVDGAVAEDIVHDLWTRLWDYRTSVNIQGQFVSYVFKALRNRIIDHMARTVNAQRYLDSLEAFAVHYGLDNTDHKLREELFWQNIERVLNRYGPKAQTIVRMRMQGYNNHEIAEKLNISEKTVRNQQSAIIKYLRSKFPYLILFLFP